MREMPKDPIILLSFVNTQLRDQFDSLEELCAAFGTEQGELEAKLEKVGFHYQADGNCFR